MPVHLNLIPYFSLLYDHLYKYTLFKITLSFFLKITSFLFSPFICFSLPDRIEKMAPPSKGLKTSSADHIRAFNVAAAEYKALASERTLADLEKILAVLTKITDVSGV
jgi:hypothetical protein